MIYERKKKFFNGLNPSFVTGNKLFWKTIKPFLSDEAKYGANIKLVEFLKEFQNDGDVVEETTREIK